MDIEKLYRVIDSCETLEQLRVASRYYFLWEWKYAAFSLEPLAKFEEKRNELS